MLFEEKLIFFPAKYPEGNWEPDLPKNFTLSDIYLDSAGVRLHGWYIEPDVKNYDAAVLLCHGNAGNITTRIPKALAIVSCGIPVFLFDYRGYGRSDDGAICENSIYQDSQTAYQWLIDKGFSEDQIVIHGISLGGGAACYLAEQNKPQALSLESTFTSIPDMCKLVYPLIPKFFVSTQFKNIERIANLDLPIQIIHGTVDDLIPHSMGEELYSRVKQKFAFISIEGAGHSDLLEVAV